MISETLSPSARNAVLALTPGQQLVFQTRSTAGSARSSCRFRKPFRALLVALGSQWERFHQLQFHR
jgi:hypothetical protein